MSQLLDYVDIPPYASPLHTHSNAIPTPTPTPTVPTLTLPSTPSSSSTTFTILPHLLSTTFQIPTTAPPSPSTRKGPTPLLTVRDPLAIPTISTNFKRFVSRCAPCFWVQDRVEEIVMWRKGWKVTAAWMAAYAFLCYYPRLIFLIPHLAILTILLSSPTNPILPPARPTTQEGTQDWQANIQAIQNLMGAYSDLVDLTQPFLPYLTHRSPYSPHILTLTLLTLPLLLLFLVVIPVPTRVLVLVAGLAPLAFTHPFTRSHLLPLIVPRCTKHLRKTLVRAIDDANLEDRHWSAEMQDVELWENERWFAEGGASGKGGWGKAYLRSGERAAWTRGRDGWSGFKEDGSADVSNLTFTLPQSWSFVETEDWRPDIEGMWVPPDIGSDDDGWVYTNDTWLDPHPAPVDTWKSTGLTRRRRWIRRVYYSDSFLSAPLSK